MVEGRGLLTVKGPCVQMTHRHVLSLSTPQEVLCKGSWTFLPRSLEWWGEMKRLLREMQHETCSLRGSTWDQRRGTTILRGREPQNALRTGVELSLEGWAEWTLELGEGHSRQRK